MKWGERANINFPHTLMPSEFKKQEINQPQRCAPSRFRDLSPVNSSIFVSKSKWPGRLYSPIGEKKLFSEKGCFARNCCQEERRRDLGKPNDNDLIFHLVIGTATYSNPDQPSLSGPEFSSDIAGDGHPKKNKKYLTCLLIVLRQSIAMK